MESVDLVPMLEDLSDNIDDLEAALDPLLKRALSETASKLPLLDKAKLYVLITYTIESILFSYLRLHGVNAREHPVFRELTRVKQYFEKIKQAETGETARTANVSLNKQAAARIIKHGLAGNEDYDRRRAEDQARGKAAAAEKLQKLNEQTAASLEAERDSSKRKADEMEGLVREEEDEDEDDMDVDEIDSPSVGGGTTPGTTDAESHKKERKSKRRNKGDDNGQDSSMGESRRSKKKAHQSPLVRQGQEVAKGAKKKKSKEKSIIPEKSNKPQGAPPNRLMQ